MSSTNLSEFQDLADVDDIKMFLDAEKYVRKNTEFCRYKDKVMSTVTEYSIKWIVLRNFKMETVYTSPYPEEFGKLECLYICEFCLNYFATRAILARHSIKCTWRHPPGNEIYRKNDISVFEVDGNKSKVYCQNLCLIAKLFLDHKTLYNAVEPFLFYTLTQSCSDGLHILGYFSKEKEPFIPYYNLSCILILPPYRRKRYGRFLIEFSYLLSKFENKSGSPERPLSDLGLLTYRAYWKDVVLQFILRNQESDEVSIKELSSETGIHSNDLISTLQYIGILKYWKGRHIILKDMDRLTKFSHGPIAAAAITMGGKNKNDSNSTKNIKNSMMKSHHEQTDSNNKYNSNNLSRKSTNNIRGKKRSNSKNNSQKGSLYLDPSCLRWKRKLDDEASVSDG